MKNSLYSANRSNQSPLSGVPAAPLLPGQRKDLRRLSRAGGCALLLHCLLSMAMYPLLELETLVVTAERPDRAILWSCFLVLLSQMTLMIAALLGLRLLDPQSHNQALCFDRPFSRFRNYSVLLMASVIFVGIAVCDAANWASYFAASLAERAGVGFEGYELAAPQNLPGFILTLIATAVTPAFVEETFMRGMVLQPLRRFGNGFAIVCSATIFALMHGNMQQIPMAFVSGLILGWVAVISESLWPSIMIHFWNNAISVMFSAVESQSGSEAAVLLNHLYSICILAVGVIGLAFLLFIRPRMRKEKMPVMIPAGKRTLRYLFGSLPMVLAIAFFCYLTYVSLYPL